MKRTFSGKIWLLSDDIDTDIIIPTEYLALPSVKEMAPFAFSPLRSDLAKSIQPGDIIVAGRNFGCGSSREQAPEVIKALGVSAIIAQSFARIFFRNAINNGLPVLECEDLTAAVQEGDELLVVPGEYVQWQNQRFALRPLADNVRSILESGGLVEAMRKRNGVG